MSIHTYDPMDVKVTFNGVPVTGFVQVETSLCAVCGVPCGSLPVGSTAQVICGDDCSREWWRTRDHFVDGASGPLCGEFDPYTGAPRYCRLHAEVR